MVTASSRKAFGRDQEGISYVHQLTATCRYNLHPIANQPIHELGSCRSNWRLGQADFLSLVLHNIDRIDLVAETKLATCLAPNSFGKAINLILQESINTFFG